jgi:hypothetical protein
MVNQPAGAIPTPGRLAITWESEHIASEKYRIASSRNHRANIEQVYLMIAPEVLTVLPSFPGTVCAVLQQVSLQKC